jgi:hypothetical protein
MHIQNGFFLIKIFSKKQLGIIVVEGFQKVFLPNAHIEASLEASLS